MDIKEGYFYEHRYTELIVKVIGIQDGWIFLRTKDDVFFPVEDKQFKVNFRELEEGEQEWLKAHWKD